MSDQAATPENTPAPEQAQAPEPSAPSGPPEWLGPIEQRMNELRDQQMAIADHLRTQQEAPEEAEEEIDLEDLYADDGSMTPELAQALIDQRVAEAMETYTGRVSHDQGLRDRDLAWDVLKEDIPDLEDEDYAREIAQEVAADLRMAGHEAMIDTPAFVELIERYHKARKFDERVASEQPPQRQVVLESGQGAAPQQQQGEDWGERIVKAAERLRPKI